MDTWLAWIGHALGMTAAAETRVAAASLPAPPPPSPTPRPSRPPGTSMSSPSSPPWLAWGKCWICSTSGKEATEGHLSSNLHTSRAMRPWDYVEQRPGIPSEVVEACLLLKPDQRQRVEADQREEDVRQWGRVPTMSGHEYGNIMLWTEANLLVLSPDELDAALREDGMLLGTSWIFVAKYLELTFNRCRREGYAVPHKLAKPLVERAMKQHENAMTPPRTAEKLCEGVGFTDETALRMSQVRLYACKQCGVAGEEGENWPRPFARLEEKDPCDHRWCETCWSAWKMPESMSEPWDSTTAGSEDEELDSSGESHVENPWADMDGVTVIYKGSLEDFCHVVDVPLPSEPQWLDEGTWLCGACQVAQCSCCDREAPTPNNGDDWCCWCCRTVRR